MKTFPIKLSSDMNFVNGTGLTNNLYRYRNIIKYSLNATNKFIKIKKNEIRFSELFQNHAYKQ
jgi:hypothetical protein